MTHSQSQLPQDLVSIEADLVSLRLDATLYPLSALYSAAYIFLDRAYVLLDQPDAGHYRVALSWKRGSTQPAVSLERLAGEFANELLSCAWRARIADDERMIIESTTARALAGALGPPSLDDLESFDFGEQEPFEDPLGIALSWEEKYGKKKKDPAGPPDDNKPEGGPA